MERYPIRLIQHPVVALFRGVHMLEKNAENRRSFERSPLTTWWHVIIAPESCWKLKFDFLGNRMEDRDVGIK